MFCKYCGAELESDALFCTSCGKRIAGAAEKAESHEQEAADTTAQQPQQARPEDAQRQEPQKSASASPEGDVWDKASLKKLDPLCIAGLILTVLSLFLIYFGVVALAAFFVSLVGYRKAKKAGQEGAILAVISMIISGVIFAAFFIGFIQYSRYEYAMYGMLNRFLHWLEGL